MSPSISPRDALAAICSFASASNSAVVITDASDPDYPIMFVNASFEAITGYAREEAVGRNCRFLQGEDRMQEDRAMVREALARGTPCECLFKNYRKTGELFWNKLYLFPIRLAGPSVTHVVGVQHDVTSEKRLLAELEDTAAERARLIAMLEVKRAETDRLSIDLINAQENERKALARDLHDELGQRLSALNLILHRARPHAGDGEHLDLWRRAERDLASLVGLVRDMSISLRPPGLDFFGLEPTVRELLGRQFSDGPDWVFEYAGLPPRLPATIEISVFRIVQESVTNVLRHAHAGRVVVEINGDGNELEVSIRDDGAGFDTGVWQERMARAGRAGLVGMRERIQLLGGCFSVDSTPGKGTRVIATLPLRRAVAADGTDERP
jgi:PAS domain S-box-containing protein